MHVAHNNITCQRVDLQICSVAMVAGICNSVGGVVFLTCHRGVGAGGEYCLYQVVNWKQVDVDVQC